MLEALKTFLFTNMFPWHCWKKLEKKRSHFEAFLYAELDFPRAGSFGERDAEYWISYARGGGGAPAFAEC